MSNEDLRVLLVECSDQDAESVLVKLDAAGYVLRPTRVRDEAGMQRALGNQSFDVILCSDDGDRKSVV